MGPTCPVMLGGIRPTTSVASGTKWYAVSTLSTVSTSTFSGYLLDTINVYLLSTTNSSNSGSNNMGSIPNTNKQASSMFVTPACPAQTLTSAQIDGYFKSSINTTAADVRYDAFEVNGTTFEYVQTLGSGATTKDISGSLKSVGGLGAAWTKTIAAGNRIGFLLIHHANWAGTVNNPTASFSSGNGTPFTTTGDTSGTKDSWVSLSKALTVYI